MAEDHAASAPPTETRPVVSSPPAHGFPVPTAGSGVPATARPAGGVALAEPAPRRSRGIKRFVFPLVILAALGYGGKMGYDYFVEGRFLVSTDDAYVGASTTIVAAKAMGHLTQVPVVDNQVVRQGDLLALIDDGDYRIAIELGPGARQHPGRDYHPLRPADRSPAGDHRPGPGPGRDVAGAVAR